MFFFSKIGVNNINDFHFDNCIEIFKKSYFIVLGEIEALIDSKSILKPISSLTFNSFQGPLTLSAWSRITVSFVLVSLWTVAMASVCISPDNRMFCWNSFRIVRLFLWKCFHVRETFIMREDSKLERKWKWQRERKRVCVCERERVCVCERERELEVLEQV